MIKTAGETGVDMITDQGYCRGNETLGINKY